MDRCTYRPEDPMLGWLATKSDEQIQQEAVEMVSALETVAHTRNITQMGEDIMTDMVRLCTIVTKREDGIMNTNNKEEEGKGQATEQQGDKGDRGQQHQPLQPHHQPLQPQQQGDREDAGQVGAVSCVISMHKRMPRSKSWASLGGIAPNEHNINPKVTNLSLPAAREDQRDGPGEP
jgi:hypothetical protein